MTEWTNQKLKKLPEPELYVGLPERTALQERYEYLKRGGEWQRELLPNDEFASPADNYAAGFLDAMRLLKVKP